MAAPTGYSVVMVAPDGREQEIEFRVESDGLSLWTTSDSAQLIDRFPFECLIKWVGAHLRSKNRGPDTCFDLNIKTTKGPRDLRLRAATSSEAAGILQDITDAVNAAAAARGIAPLAPAPSGRAPALAKSATTRTSPAMGTGPAPPPTSVTLPADVASAAAAAAAVPPPPTSSRRPMVPPQQTDPSRVSAGVSWPQGGAPSAGVAKAVQNLTGTRLTHWPPTGARKQGSDKQTSIGPGTSLWRKVDLGALSVGAGVLPPDAKTRVKFLEDLVRRLSEELSKVQTRGLSADDLLAAQPSATAAAFLEGLDRDAPLPPWLVDQRLMSPLLVVYDQRIADLESQMENKAANLGDVEQQMNEIVTENERLHAEVSRLVAQLAQQADAAAAGEGAAARGTSGSSELAERLELMTQENDLLVRQQQELDNEIQALHRQLAARTEENLEATSELARVTAELQGREDKEDDLAVKLARAKEATRKARQEAEDARNESQQAMAVVEDHKAAARRASDAVAELQRKNAALVAEGHSSRSTAQAASNNATMLQVELGTVKEQLLSAEREAGNAQQEVAQLRTSLATMEAKLFEYQRKDAEVYSRIKEAMEMAEEAKLARDAGNARERQLQQEVEGLRTRLAASRQESADRVADELSAKIRRLEKEVAGARTEARESAREAASLQAERDRLAREKSAVLGEKEALMREGLAAANLSGIVSGPVSPAAAIEALDAKRVAERERDSLATKLRSAELRHEHVRRDWELERSELEARVAELRRKLAALEATATSTGTSAAESKRVIDALRLELSHLGGAKARAEQQLSSKLLAVRQEHDVQVKLLASKLEAAIDANNKSVSEAEALLSLKEDLLNRWKAEAQEAHAKLEAAQEASGTDIGELQASVSSLTAQVEGLQAENAAMEAELAALRDSEGHLRPTAEAAKRQAGEAVAAMTAASRRAEGAIQRAAELEAALEASERDRLKSERSARTLTAKVEALQSQTDSLSAMLSSRTGDAPVGVTPLAAAPGVELGGPAHATLFGVA